ncbi:uncharacterized protein A4U43_C04F11330 [Asparagus officinalis]|uniref:Uncharacterized protein n=1 Tax=Asparagus officinalis TaxID=4686 RepID=A0A5P1F4H7_ASPOF|nr:uncharacterized protein A4U43_C04F11330 [Asparagus officinalis]
MGDVFYKIPGKSHAQGIRPIVIDQDILDMVASLGPSKRIFVYVSHRVDQYEGDSDVAIESGVQKEDDDAQHSHVGNSNEQPKENPTVIENPTTTTYEFQNCAPLNTKNQNDPPFNMETQNSPPIDDNCSANVENDGDGCVDENAENEADDDGSNFEVSEGDNDDGDDEFEANDLESKITNEIKKIKELPMHMVLII